MMEIELPKLNPSQQEMDMIDILWKQDIDLGAGREVFDVSYRQKEHELQKQRALEEEKRQQLLLEQEKALLAQLQLDEETGEFVPRTMPSGQPQPAPDVPSENIVFPVDEEAMSFDECMELLAQTFPLVEASEAASTGLGTSAPPTENSQLLMAPEQQPPLAQTPLLQGPQKTWPDLDQAWMELLSIPELEQCLNIQMQEMPEPSNYMSTNPVPEAEDPSFGLFMPGLTDAMVPQPKVSPNEFIGNFEVTFPGAGPANLLSQMSLKVDDTVVIDKQDELYDMFYPELLSTAKGEVIPQPCSTMSGVCQVTEAPNSSPLKPLDMQELSAGDPFQIQKSDMAMEFPDSDSGLSLDASPNMSSPEKSTFGDGSLGFSDSDLDEMDSGPGSDSDYSESFSMPFSTTQPTGTNSNITPPRHRHYRNTKHPKTELAEASVHSKPPFTKDKAKKRSEARLSRDEQRAKTLQIPFTVNMIINLPVDDFNEMMSKHQLNEAQLALVRDIRRRGKNKVAAQNCRKRKMENIVGLECDLDSLKEERERLLREKTEQSSSLRQMKQQLNSLYLEVFSMLRDEQGRPYSPTDYSLQQTSDGTVFLVPRVKKTLIKSNA